MVGVPVRFKRVMEVFESSGSDYSSEISSSMTDLSDLVNSFIEKGDSDRDNREKIKDQGDDDDFFEREYCFDSEKNSLKSLLQVGGGEDDAVRRNIGSAVEEEWRSGGDAVVGKSSSSPEFKRQVMARLRARGFDAGLCKSKWERNGRLPAGDYAYIDINVGGNRYIIDAFGEEFEIARASECYTSLLEVFPSVSVLKPKELKQVVRIMCTAIKKSMKNMDMSMPPWRRHEYVQAKWFGSYKRTINEFSSKKGSGLGSSGSDYDPKNKRTIGFTSDSRGINYFFREGFASNKFRSKVGNLAMAINGE